MRRIILFLVIPAVFLIVSPAAAIMGIGIHGGVDNITVDSFDNSFTLDDGTSVSLKREEISSPVMFGADLTVDALPFIDLQLSADACFQKYNITYVTPIRTQEEEATFGRVGIYATIKKNIISFPPVINTLALYTGAGLGIHLISPVMGKDLIQKELKSFNDILKPDDIVDKLSRIGGHVLVGTKFKPPVIPFKINLDAKYTFVGKGDYEEPDNFLSVYLSFGYAF